MGVLEVLSVGFILGITLVIPPGPMNGLIAAQTARRGLRAGILTGAGAMTADLVLASVVLGLGAAALLGPYSREIDLVGAGVLFLFAYRLFRQRHQTVARPSGRGRAYLAGLMLGIGNPFQVLWWLTAGLALVGSGGALLLGGLFLAVALWILVFPLGLHRILQRHPRASEGLAMASMLLLAAFALVLLYLALA
jgi:threonine/homoserine/homoserine lactone efflux protein